MEQQQITVVEGLPVSVIDGDTVYDPHCAWCLGEQGIKPQSGSHGMCQRHRAQIRAEAALIRLTRGVTHAAARAAAQGVAV